MRKAVIALCLLLAACDEPTPLAPLPRDLTGTTWKLQSIRRAGLPAIDIPADRRFTVAFEQDGRLNVRADCNACNGRYQVEGSLLHAGNVACTRAFCGADSPDVDFLRALQSPGTITATDGTLLIDSSGTVLVFSQ